MSNRNLLVDVAKGIGIVLVVLGHSGIEFGHYLIYMFHMPLFFFLSGMLHKDRGLNELLSVKVPKMGKAYLLFFTLCTLVSLALNGRGFLYEVNILNPKGSAGPLWFLISLFEANVCFALIQKYANKHYFTVCFMLTVLGFIFCKKGIHLHCFVDSTMSIMFFYGLGYAFKSKDNKRLLSIPWYMSASFFIIMYIWDWKVLHLIGNDIYSNTIMDNFLLYILSALAGISFTFSIAYILTRKLQLAGGVAVMGRNSLYVFAMHRPVLDICHSIHPANNDCIRFIYVLIALAVSYYIGKIISNLRLI
jgi:O-acetyl transferase